MRTIAGSRLRLFVDPGSTSAGWALYDGERLLDSGTCAAKKGGNAFDRLSVVGRGFIEAFHLDFKSKSNIDEVHIETLNYQTHFMCLWSVGVIGFLFATHGVSVYQDVWIKSWQKHAGWAAVKDAWKERGFKSQDEWAAVCMGAWWLSALKEGELVNAFG
jgi:hypothetical protein